MVAHFNMLPIALMLLCSCAASAVAGPTPQVFKAPEAFQGQRVRICGYVRHTFEDRNVWASKKEAQHGGGGLGLIIEGSAGKARGWHGSTRCFEAEIVRTGCADDMICTWSNFPYAARTRID